VAELEAKIAAVSECKFAVGASSGTDAIMNSLMSLDIRPDDEIITTPFTFFSTVGCVARLGAKIVFADIDPKTYNIDPEGVKGAVTEKTKAIMPVHLFGQMADMDPIMEVAAEHNLAVIEDAAQSISSTWQHRDGWMFQFLPEQELRRYRRRGDDSYE
jgi:dTDP-4-amino-4,6-dideoxygalactose transaminase